MITFESDLIMTEDMEFKESIYVRGDIEGKDGIKYNLRVAGDINARDIDAGNINAWNIDAWNIDAGDINARDINARNINACDIDYWAVCFAYFNLKCRSIRGRRTPCKEPFVIDGKIEIKEDKKA